MTAILDADAFNRLIRDEMPWAAAIGMTADELARGTARLRVPFDAGMLRPGGTISGPTMMTLADATMYATVLSAIGPQHLAVTTSFNINFLRKPGPSDLIAEGRLLKLGRRLAVIEVTLHSEGADDAVAHATGTYSIPPGAA